MHCKAVVALKFLQALDSMQLMPLAISQAASYIDQSHLATIRTGQSYAVTVIIVLFSMTSWILVFSGAVSNLMHLNHKHQ